MDPTDPGAAKRPEQPVTLSTAVLLDQVRAGDERALGQVFERYRERLRRWASGRLPAYARDGMETEDLVQEAFIQSARHIQGFDVRWKGAFHAYIRRAILNRIRDQVRRAAVRDRVVEQVEERRPRDPSPLETLIGVDALERYEAALERLDDGDRELIVARIEMDATYEELAEMTGKPSADAARMGLKRALMRLAKTMDGEGGRRG